jgi:hypothetical protein
MARDEPQIAHEGDWRRAYSERRFGVLLVILVVLLAGPPVMLGFGLSAAWFDGLMALLMVAAILSLCFERHQRLFALLLGIPTVLLSVGGHALPGEASVPAGGDRGGAGEPAGGEGQAGGRAVRPNGSPCGGGRRTRWPRRWRRWRRG